MKEKFLFSMVAISLLHGGMIARADTFTLAGDESCLALFGKLAGGSFQGQGFSPQEDFVAVSNTLHSRLRDLTPLQIFSLVQEATGPESTILARVDFNGGATASDLVGYVTSSQGASYVPALLEFLSKPRSVETKESEFNAETRPISASDRKQLSEVLERLKKGEGLEYASSDDGTQGTRTILSEVLPRVVGVSRGGRVALLQKAYPERSREFVGRTKAHMSSADFVDSLLDRQRLNPIDPIHFLETILQGTPSSSSKDISLSPNAHKVVASAPASLPAAGQSRPQTKPRVTGGIFQYPIEMFDAAIRASADNQLKGDVRADLMRVLTEYWVVRREKSESIETFLRNAMGDQEYSRYKEAQGSITPSISSALTYLTNKKTLHLLVPFLHRVRGEQAHFDTFGLGEFRLKGPELERVFDQVKSSGQSPTDFFKQWADRAPEMEGMLFRGMALSGDELSHVLAAGIETDKTVYMNSEINLSRALGDPLLFAVGNARNYSKNYAVVVVVNPKGLNVKDKLPGRSLDVTTKENVPPSAIEKILIYDPKLQSADPSAFPFREISSRRVP